MRSRMPPWPGSRVPESLTPAPRLTADSRRSPSWAAMLRIAARRRDCQSGSEMWRRVLPRAVRASERLTNSIAASTLPTMEAKEPSPGFAGAETGGEFAFAEGAADVESGDVAGPDADHEEEDERGAILLFPEKGNQRERVGDVDEAEEALRGVGEDLDEGGAEAVPGEEREGEGAEDGELVFDGEVGQGDDEGEGGSEGHPPDGDAEFRVVGFGADRGELEILVGGELGDDGGEEGDHPELAKEDEGEDDEDEDCGGEDSFHEVLNRIYRDDVGIGCCGILPDGPPARRAVTS